MLRFTSSLPRRAGDGETTPIRIVKGLDIPLAGAPDQVITDGAQVRSVALLGGDYLGLRPALLVKEGEGVKLGQPLFADRRHPEILFASPGSGTVREINRGPRRALLSVVVELSGDDEEAFSAWPAEQLAHLRRDQVADLLLASGQWAAFRTRPYSRTPDPSTTPASIFVTAMDSNPLAARPEVVIERHREDFANGLTVIAHLSAGRVFLCAAPDSGIPRPPAPVSLVEFTGPHPAGLPGTHIHLLDPVDAGKSVWHVGYQDVIAIGKLCTGGRLWVERIAALAGPQVERPRLIRTRLGASTNDLTQGELRQGHNRIISGSVLSGRHAQGAESYLGRFHHQLSVLAEGPSQPPSGGLMRYRGNGFSAYSIFRKRQARALTTAMHGETTAMLPLGGFERVMPLDILPTQLLRALLVGDTDMAQALGCLELDEEDLALCTFLCPGKIEYGPLLRAALARIEKEG